MFCKNCLDMCLGFKKECPMCKADLNGKEIYLVESKEKKEDDDEEMNPLIKKYGSKLGKLITKSEESYKYLVESIRTFPKPDEFVEILEEINFKRTSIRQLSGNIVCIYKSRKN